MSTETDRWPFVPARWFTKVTGKRTVRVIVVHDMEAPEGPLTAENVANYFKTTDTKASAHVCIDNNSVVQSVLDNNVAWAAPGANHDGIQLELAGYAKQTPKEWLDDYGVQLLNRAAHVAAQYCIKYGIPVKRLSNAELKAGARGIVGHVQVSAVYGLSSHTDPGKGFPWGYYMNCVQTFYDIRKAA